MIAVYSELVGVFLMFTTLFEIISNTVCLIKCLNLCRASIILMFQILDTKIYFLL